MVHNCIDWSATPPARKTPLLVLTHGDDHVYTLVPEQLETLEDVARREFNLGGVEIAFYSACANLCDGRPARITDGAWRHISPLIGCVAVEVAGTRPADGRSPRASAKRKSSCGDADEAIRDEPSPYGLDTGAITSAKRAVRNWEDVGNDRDGASTSGDHREDASKEEDEEGTSLPRKPRNNGRRTVPESEDEGEESKREHQTPPLSQVPPAASPPNSPWPGKEVEKERHHRSQLDTESNEPLHEPSRPVKREKRESESASASQQNPYDQHSQLPHPGSQPEMIGTQTQVESSGSQKLLIRVAHRPSKQEARFATKSTNKVSKVLAGVCRSFDLDVSRAALYLIVSTEDEFGEVEDLFPCERDETIARAGAEHDAQSTFLLKIAGEEA